MNREYDVIIISAGPGGIFCAYELNRQEIFRAKEIVSEAGREGAYITGTGRIAP